ncbi:hypothetical protein SAMN05720781_0115 [Fibrobacter sp. UWT3]|uniref:hypothetical protein n=1 Tax=Fibrobacter sp. UWT3 TaxID=1896225 RepID=UPI000BC63F7E|nr:hypothetical protein [Fibrobacter sp. UWT3]SOE45948.1 hypothetical protein SAMN05720781_0115 [Fibrobacter sp. UWT3]
MKRAVECLILGVALLAGCSDSGSETAGATSETTNGIAVMVVDAASKPVPQARVTLYSKADFAVVNSAVANDSGLAHFDSLAEECSSGNCFVEGIAGADSALMNWSEFKPAISETEIATQIELAPSASLTLRTGATTDEEVFEFLRLESTPYMASRSGSDYVFAHVPAGMFTVVAGDSAVATFSLEAGAEADTLVNVPGKTLEYVFEDFDDGDSLNNLAKNYRNYGWYYIASGTATWIKPDSAGGFGGAIVDGDRGKYLSLQFDLGDSGYVLLGTHLGLDTGYYDLSALTAIRMKVRGDCDFSFALEHYKDLGDNNFQKSLWHATADTAWKEFVFRPGREKLNASVYQVEWKNIAHEIGFVSIFASSGSFIEIDEIVFEGIDTVAPAP